MSKKIFLSILITCCFLLGMNNVKAVPTGEGYGKHGEKGTVCQYCYGGDCYYLVGDAIANYGNYQSEDRQRLFHNNGTKEITIDDGWGDITALYFADPDGCEPGRYEEFYVVKQHMTECKATGILDSPILNQLFHGIGSLANLEFTYYITPGSNNSYESFLNWDNLFCDEDVSKREVKVYKLKEFYGINVEITDPKVSDVIREMKRRSDEATIQQGNNKGCAILNEPTKEKINWFLDLIKYGGAVLAIVLGAVDFLRAVLSDEDNANKKAFERFVKRIIAAVLLFLLPLIIQLLFTTLNNPVIEIPGFNVDSPTCGLGVSE